MARACKARSALPGAAAAALSVGADALRRQMSHAKTVVANKSILDVGSLAVGAGRRLERPSAEPDKVGASSSKNA